MARPTKVEPRDGYRIWIRYSDGAAGVVDLSHLAGRGVFKAWKNRTFFCSVHLTANGAVAWDEDVELCPDALYIRLTNKAVEEVMPGTRALEANA